MARSLPILALPVRSPLYHSTDAQRLGHSLGAQRPKTWRRFLKLSSMDSKSGRDFAVDVGASVIRIATKAQPVRERMSTTDERRAFSGGEVVDTEAAVAALEPMLRPATGWRGLSRVRTLACVPTDASAWEKELLADCLSRSGADAVFMSPAPLAAAIGAGMDVSSHYAQLVLDIGEGVTDCAIIRSGQVIRSHAVRLGCANMRERLVAHLRQRYKLRVSELDVEPLLSWLGIGMKTVERVLVEGWRGKRLAVVSVSVEKLKEAIAPVVASMLNAIHTVLKEVTPGTATEIIENGMVITGSGALLNGMPEEIARATNLEVRVAPDPTRAVVLGGRAILPMISALGLWN